MDQLITKFKDTESKYNQLKARLGRGEITQDQAKADIKKLMIQDDTGTYWMMGGKTGKWYKHINNQWQEASPYDELFPPVIPEAPVQVETEKEDDAVFPLDAYQSDNTYTEAGQVEKLETLGKLSYGDLSDQEVQTQSASSVEQQDSYEKIESYGQYDQYEDSVEPVDKRDKTDPFGVASVSRGDFEVQQNEGQEEEDAFSLSHYQSESDSSLDLMDGKESASTLNYEGKGGLDSFDTQSKSYTFATQNTDENFSLSSDINFGDENLKVEDTNPYRIKEDDHYTDRETGYGIAIDLEQEEAAMQGSSVQGSSMFGDAQEEEESYIPASSKPLYQSLQSEDEPVSASSGYMMTPSQQESPRQAQQQMQQTSPMSSQSQVSQPGVGVPAPDLSLYTQCTQCKSKIPPISVYCPFCGANQKELDGKAMGKAQQKRLRKEGESELVIKSIRIFSLFFFLGGVGLIFGVLLGATYGVLKDFSLVVPWDWPEIVGGTRGGVIGGMVFAMIGGIGGFFLFAVFSFIPSCLYNLLAFVFGGVRFRVKG